MAPSQLAHRLDAVFEGGGVKGIALVGALRAFEEQGFHWHNLAGASAGAIIAALVAVGYSAEELQEIMLSKIRFADFKDPAFIVPWLGLLVSNGMYSGENFLNTMRRLIADKTGKKCFTFGDLELEQLPGDSKEEYETKYKYKLRVIVSDVSTNRMLVLPQDADKIGEDPAKLEVALAVRMSASFPFFFKPVVHTESIPPHPRHWLMDGGMLSNFPVWLFDSPAGKVPAWPTVGFLLAEPESPTGQVRPIRGLLSLLKEMAATVTSAHDLKSLDSFDKNRIVSIPTGGYATLDFDIDRAGQEWLYKSGHDSAREFLRDFDIKTYTRQRAEFSRLVEKELIQAR